MVCGTIAIEFESSKLIHIEKGKIIALNNFGLIFHIFIEKGEKNKLLNKKHRNFLIFFLSQISGQIKYLVQITKLLDKKIMMMNHKNSKTIISQI